VHANLAARRAAEGLPAPAADPAAADLAADLAVDPDAAWLLTWLTRSLRLRGALGIDGSMDRER